MYTCSRRAFMLLLVFQYSKWLSPGLMCGMSSCSAKLPDDGHSMGSCSSSAVALPFAQPFDLIYERAEGVLHPALVKGWSCCHC